MRVIKHRISDDLCFPEIGVTICFAQAEDGSIEVAIEAPPDLAVGGVGGEPVTEQRLPREARHEIRNELHTLSIGLHLYKEQVGAGLVDEAGATFRDLRDAISRISSHEVLRGSEAGSGDRPPSTPTTDPRR